MVDSLLVGAEVVSLSTVVALGSFGDVGVTLVVVCSPSGICKIKCYALQYVDNDAYEIYHTSRVQTSSKSCI